LVAEVRKNNPNLEKANFMVFDMLSLPDFERGETELTLQERLMALQKLFGKQDSSLVFDPKSTVASLKDFSIKIGHTSIWCVQQLRVPRLEWLKSVVDLDTKDGWEGFILRKDAPYKGKRRYLVVCGLFVVCCFQG
jgi:ATP-dependent DNA ligase